MGGLVALVLGGAVGAIALRRLVRRVRLAERRAQARGRMAEIGAMTAGLAHEIKNPLSTIGLNAQLLGEGVAEGVVEETERGRLLRRVDAIRREADRLRDILRDFLQFAGELHCELQDVDLHVLIEEMVDFYLPQAQHHGLRLRSDLAGGPLPVRADPRLLKQALLNLLVNATQAMAPEEQAQGEGRRAGETSELILRTRRGQGRRPVAELHVIDTGPGISPEQMDKIFQPYFTTKPGGSGLGLPTTKRLIEAQQGELEVHSEAGRGTDFMIRLPLQDYR